MNYSKGRKIYIIISAIAVLAVLILVVLISVIFLVIFLVISLSEEEAEAVEERIMVL